jgi:protein disulfide-isomerase-like protein
MYLKVITDDDATKLSQLLKDGDWMVLYYAEWCGHCNSMKPEWEKVIEKFKDSGKIHIADVNSEVIKTLEHKPKIEGFPTIKMYNKGREIAKFEDERSAEKIEKFAISNSNSKSKKMSSPSPAYNTTIANKINIDLEKMERSPMESAEPAEPVVPVVPVVVSNNRNQIKKLSITELKDEIMKSHRNTKMPSRMMVSTDMKKNRVRNSKKGVETMDALDMLLQPPVPSIKSSIKKKTHKNNKKKKTNTPNSASSLACAEIRKAKICKNNPKCMYDYTEFKCKNKVRNRSHTAKSNKKSKQSKKQSKEKSTKEILKALQKSFSKISNEAKKDSNLLQIASQHL